MRSETSRLTILKNLSLGLEVIMAASMVLVTLDNFAEKFPPWRPDQENHLYAQVDMGR